VGASIRERVLTICCFAAVFFIPTLAMVVICPPTLDMGATIPAVARQCEKLATLSLPDTTVNSASTLAQRLSHPRETATGKQRDSQASLRFTPSPSLLSRQIIPTFRWKSGCRDLVGTISLTQSATAVEPAQSATANWLSREPLHRRSRSGRYQQDGRTRSMGWGIELLRRKSSRPIA
jgi:hypothetical protein